MAPLPDELLQLICENFRLRGDIKKRGQDRLRFVTLMRLSQTNRAFRRVAQPIMVHTLDFRKCEWSVLRSTLQLFLMQPHLAAFVRKLCTSPWIYDEDLGKPSTKELRAVLAAADQLHISKQCRQKLRYELAYGYGHGFEDAELTLLLCLCTKVEILDIEVPGAMCETLVAKVLVDSVSLPATNPNQMSFRHVRQVQLRDGSAIGSTAVSDVSALFYLPSLEVFYAEFLNASQSELNLPAMVTRIRKIHLESPFLDADVVEEMLLVSLCLRSLTLEWENYQIWQDTDYTEYGDVIREHAKNLRELHITFDGHGTCGSQYGTLGSLASLTHLRELSVPFFALYDYDLPYHQQAELKSLLPPSLRSLSVPADAPREASSEVAKFLEQQLSDIIHDPRFKTLQRLQFDGALADRLGFTGSRLGHLAYKGVWDTKRGPRRPRGGNVRWKFWKKDV